MMTYFQLITPTLVLAISKEIIQARKRHQKRNRHSLVNFSQSNEDDSQAAPIPPPTHVPNLTLRPQAPTDVTLGPGVQYLDAPLSEVQTSIRTQVFTRRSNRTSGQRLDYKSYDQSGLKRSKQ